MYIKDVDRFYKKLIEANYKTELTVKANPS